MAAVHALCQFAGARGTKNEEQGWLLLKLAAVYTVRQDT